MHREVEAACKIVGTFYEIRLRNCSEYSSCFCHKDSRSLVNMNLAIV